MNKQNLKAVLLESIEGNKSEIIRIGEEIYKNPETGFKEFNTEKIVMNSFRDLGMDFKKIQEYPGLKATIDTGREGPGVAIVAEMDSVICREHPDCNPETGAVHACGHNAQIAAMLGALKSIINTGITQYLSGKLHFIAVPAEEYIEVAYRMQLREKGILKYFGGKPELLRKGFFDDVDMCVSIHSSGSTDKKIITGRSSNGCIVKNIKYIGKAAHAGGSPDKGINALYASNLGLMAINSIRETFRESEYIRVHPIITKGGDIVNVIPADVRMETYVRGKTLQDILQASMKVDRALIGGAYAMGAKVEIEDIPGYLPTEFDNGLRAVAKEVSLQLISEQEYLEGGHGTGSTDWGDLSTIMPVLETSIAGTVGTFHGADFKIADTDTAYVLAAKYLALMSVELLMDGAEKAKAVLSNFKPLFKSKQEYFDKVDRMFRKRILPQEDYRDNDIENLLND